MRCRRTCTVRCAWPWVIAFLSILALHPVETAWAQEQIGPGADKAIAAEAGPLDGRTFRATIVRDDSNQNDGQSLIDQLIFKSGKFSSAVCRRYNFAEAPYWVRHENGRVHFFVELKSPTDGTMRWKGSIAGDALEGTMRWIKKRWYWTIDVEHKIRGKLSKELTATSPGTN